VKYQKTINNSGNRSNHGFTLQLLTHLVIYCTSFVRAARTNGACQGVDFRDSLAVGLDMRLGRKKIKNQLKPLSRWSGRE
jgi:hypothetical protein